MSFKKTAKELRLIIPTVPGEKCSLAYRKIRCWDIFYLTSFMSDLFLFMNDVNFALYAGYLRFCREH